MNAKLFLLITFLTVIVLEVAASRGRRRTDDDDDDDEELLHLAEESLIAAKKSKKAAQKVVDALEEEANAHGGRQAMMNVPIWPFYHGQSSDVGNQNAGFTYNQGPAPAAGGYGQPAAGATAAPGGPPAYGK